MGRRLEFRNRLQAAMGSNKIYFQTPGSSRMVYPCCIYELQKLDIRYADDIRYKNHECYQVILIDPNPDSVYFDRILNEFTYIRFDRHYTADDLNHFVFTIYF